MTLTDPLRPIGQPLTRWGQSRNAAGAEHLSSSGMALLLNITLFVVATMSIGIALVCGFAQAWGEGAYFWAQAATMLVLLHGRTDPF